MKCFSCKEKIYLLFVVLCVCVYIYIYIYIRTDFYINGSTVLNNVLYCTKLWLCVIVILLVEVKVTP